MSYRLLPQAERDLEAIGDYIAERNPAAAVDLVRRLHARWELLAEFPEAAPTRPEIDVHARQLVVGSYLTLYRINDGVVEIVRVLHGRRDVKSDDFG